MDNKTLMLQEFEELKGQFVITSSWKIERLVAIGEDEHDYYYVTYNGRKLKWNTGVGRLMKLKGKLDDKDYNELVRIAKLNHFDQITIWGNKEPEKFKTLQANHIRDLLTLEEGDHLLTELYLTIH
jgi:hypothetical protein